MSDALPDDWRERTLAMIRGAAPLAGDWFRGGPTRDPLGQIAVYRRQFELRHGEALRIELPGVVALLGDDAAGELFTAYIAEHPSRSWTLDRVALAFADWLAARGAPVDQVEMARLDQAVQRSFSAAEPAELGALAAGLPPLRLSPPVSLLRLTTPMHRYRSAALTGEPLPALEPGDYRVVIFRREGGVRHWEAPPLAFALLEHLARDPSAEAALEAAFGAGLLDPADVVSQVQQVFAELASRRLVEPDVRT